MADVRNWLERLWLRMFPRMTERDVRWFGMGFDAGWDCALERAKQTLRENNLPGQADKLETIKHHSSTLH